MRLRNRGTALLLVAAGLLGIGAGYSLPLVSALIGTAQTGTQPLDNPATGRVDPLQQPSLDPSDPERARAVGGDELPGRKRGDSLHAVAGLVEAGESVAVRERVPTRPLAQREQAFLRGGDRFPRQ